jgi:hypothetical protein
MTKANKLEVQLSILSNTQRDYQDGWRTLIR